MEHAGCLGCDQGAAANLVWIRMTLDNEEIVHLETPSLFVLFRRFELSQVRSIDPPPLDVSHPQIRSGSVPWSPMMSEGYARRDGEFFLDDCNLLPADHLIELLPQYALCNPL